MYIKSFYLYERNIKEDVNLVGYLTVFFFFFLKHYDDSLFFCN